MIDLTQLMTLDKKMAAHRLAALTAFRADREKFLNRLTGIGLAAQISGDALTIASVVKVRQGLLDLTTARPVVGATTPDQLKLAMKAAYAAVLTGAAPVVFSAFKGVDA